MSPTLRAESAGQSREHGMAMISTLLVLALMSGLLIGFTALVMSDQRTSAANRDQSQAYAGAHAGIEKLTADLGQLFSVNFAPSGEQIHVLANDAHKPALPGITYNTAGGDAGYAISFIDRDGDGNPDVEDPNGTSIGSGNYQGLVGLITPYTISVTAQTSGGAEVSMRRTLQTVAIPVFQFGIFSENDQSFFAGPDFSFGGRIHTNQNLFLKQDNGGTLTISDRVTAVGEVIRARLANGVDSHHGTVRMAVATGCPAPPAAINANCRNLAENEGSVVVSVPPASAAEPNEPTWTNLSTGAYNGFIRSGGTGATRLDLPLVSAGAQPIDLIRRPPAGEATASDLYKQRFFGLATLRILLSDANTNITALPSVISAPVPLSGTFTPSSGVTNGLSPSAVQRFATSSGVASEGYRTSNGTSSIDGMISIELQQRNGVWVDVTREILSLGFTGRNISTGTVNVPKFGTQCAEPNPNAVIRLQRIRDQAKPDGSTTYNACGFSGGAYTTLSTNYWPNTLYDPREAVMRDADNALPSTGKIYWGGVMHYVELDVNNLRRYLIGEIGNHGCASTNTSQTCPMDVTGYVVYFSDRRTNRNGANETGEYGWEDNINPSSPTSQPNGSLDGAFTDVDHIQRWAEDVNQNGIVDRYGNTVRFPAGTAIAPPTGSGEVTVANYNVYSTAVAAAVGRVNRAFFFRRALKLVNGGLGNLPANGSQGLTVASENPVYIQGNFNACTNAAPASPTYSPSCVGGVGFDDTPGGTGRHVSAAVIADAVTLLSNSWNDIRSFNRPHSTAGSSSSDPETKIIDSNVRQAVTTWYRLGIIAGKGLTFQRPTNNSQDHMDFGTDGGAHNFIRYIENWGGATLNYRGSLISFYTSRQATGTYKCCDVVYTAPGRGYKFDVEFLNPNLLPPRTPMFRSINTLTFRQILRPTEE